MEGTSGQGGYYADQVAGAGSWIHSTALRLPVPNPTDHEYTKPACMALADSIGYGRQSGSALPALHTLEHHLHSTRPSSFISARAARALDQAESSGYSAERR
jgi:hypothetical protein